MTVRDHRFADEAFPVIVAHRGASSTHPENTLVSFEAALHLGAPVIEFDVRMTSDGVAVVMHDPTVDRTTDGSGAVHEMSAAAIAELGAGTKDVPAGVPTLAAVLDLASGRAGVAIEIKNLPGEPGYDPRREVAVHAVHEELGRTAFEGPVLVIAFNPSSIAASKAIDPRVPTGLLCTEYVDPRDALRHVEELGHDLVLPGTRGLEPLGEMFVDEVHRAGRRVGTWTVDEVAELERVLGWGIDAVASNDVAMALDVVTARRG